MSEKKAGAKREFYAASQIFSENLRDSQKNKSAKRTSGSHPITQRTQRTRESTQQT